MHGNEYEALFSSLADRTRLRLLNLMSGGEICVCYFVDILGESQPKISRHLAYMRRAGIVAARRDGKWMHYRIVEPADPGAANVVQATMSWIGSDPDMERDRQRLRDICCAPQRPAHLSDAPLPSRFAP